MKRNLNLTILIAFLFVLIINSCRQENEFSKTESDVNLHNKNITSKVYQKKSPFKTDTILINIVQKTFLNHADVNYFEGKHGNLYWDYGISLENTVHHSVIIPIIKNNQVISTMHAILKNNKIFFNERKDKKLTTFFNKLISSKIISFAETSNTLSQNSKIIATNCHTSTFTVGCPPGYGDCQDISYSITSCDYMDDGTGFPSSGNPDQMEICHPDLCGGGGGGYDPEFDTFLNPPPPPNNPIADITKFLSCLNINQSANLTVYAQKMVVNNNGVGHAFISISQGNNTMTFGFYPKNGFPDNYTGPSIFNNDGGHAFTYSWNAGTITPTQLQQIIGITIAFSHSDYQLLLNNCSDFATYALMIAGVNCDTNAIDTPNTVSNLIENMPHSSNGVAPQTQRTCP